MTKLNIPAVPLDAEPTSDPGSCSWCSREYVWGRGAKLWVPLSDCSCEPAIRLIPPAESEQPT